VRPLHVLSVSEGCSGNRQRSSSARDKTESSIMHHGLKLIYSIKKVREPTVQLSVDIDVSTEHTTGLES